jgi:hypothetical protein
LRNYFLRHLRHLFLPSLSIFSRRPSRRANAGRLNRPRLLRAPTGRHGSCVYKNWGQPLWPARSPSRPLHTETVAATVPKPAAPSQPTREIRREGQPRDILCKRSTQSSVRCPWDSSDLEEGGRGRATRNLSPRSSESLTVPRAPPRAAGGDLQPVNQGINAARVFVLPFDRYICSELGFEPPWCAGFTCRQWLRRAVLRHRVSRSELGKGCGSR